MNKKSTLVVATLTVVFALLTPPLRVVNAQDLLVYDFQGEPSQIHPDAVFG